MISSFRSPELPKMPEILTASGFAFNARPVTVVGSFAKTLRVTPAMAANVTKRLWEMSDIVDVLEAWEAI